MKRSENWTRPIPSTGIGRQTTTVWRRTTSVMASQFKIKDLDPSRKENLKNQYTHAVDSDINILGNNRVLKDHPPPIAAEEQRLNRRQRWTLTLTVRTLPSTSTWCSANQATSVLTVELRHKRWDTCHPRIYGGIRWDRLVSSARHSKRYVSS